MSNETALEVIPASAAPNMDAMERADLPAIWNGFREQALKLKATAETLVVTEANQKSEMQIARTTRLALRQIRVAIEHKRVEIKEEIVQRGRVIDGAANELKALIVPLEERLAEQEQFAERLEAKRLAALKEEREALLAPYVPSMAGLNVAGMEAEDFGALLGNYRAAHEARIEFERKAKEESVARVKAEAEERERIRQENARLRQEALERESTAKAEREKAEKERAAAEAKARKERQAAEAKAAAELAAVRAEAKKRQDAADAIARQERAAREMIEKQMREKAEVENAARLAAEKAASDAAKAPDKTKILAFAATVRAMKAPDCSTSEGKAAAKDVTAKIKGFAAWIETRANSL